MRYRLKNKYLGVKRNTMIENITAMKLRHTDRKRCQFLQEKSSLSTQATFSPRNLASSAAPAPVAPPPMMRTSYSAPDWRSSSIFDLAGIVNVSLTSEAGYELSWRLSFIRRDILATGRRLMLIIKQRLCSHDRMTLFCIYSYQCSMSKTEETTSPGTDRSKLQSRLLFHPTSRNVLVDSHNGKWKSLQGILLITLYTVLYVSSSKSNLSGSRIYPWRCSVDFSKKVGQKSTRSFSVRWNTSKSLGILIHEKSQCGGTVITHFCQVRIEIPTDEP